MISTRVRVVWFVPYCCVLGQLKMGSPLSVKVCWMSWRQRRRETCPSRPSLKGMKLDATQIVEHLTKSEPQSKAAHNKGMSGLNEDQAKAIGRIRKHTQIIPRSPLSDGQPRT